jgi:hypothetical protein
VGTPYEGDLSAVRAALLEDGRFPRLQFTSNEVR